MHWKKFWKNVKKAKNDGVCLPLAAATADAAPGACVFLPLCAWTSSAKFACSVLGETYQLQIIARDSSPKSSR